MYNEGVDSNLPIPGLAIGTFKRVVIFVAFLTVIFSTGLYYVLGSGTRRELIEKADVRQEQVITVGAQAMGTFLELFGNSLTLLAENQKVVDGESEVQEIFDTFVERWKETPVNGVLRIDKDGKIVIHAAKSGSIVMEKLENDVLVDDRDYFLWAKEAKKGDIFVGRPLIPRTGNLDNQYIIPLATPVFRDDDFDGLVLSSILLTELIKDYLEPLKMTSQAKIYLMDSKGTVLYGPVDSLIGVNFIQNMIDRPFLGSEIIIDYLDEKIKNTRSGKLDLAYPDEISGELTRFLVAYTSVGYDGDRLILAHTVPINEALSYIAPIYVNQLGVMIVGFLVVLMLTVTFVKFRKNEVSKLS